jgi:hypothetical protein
VIFTCQQKWMWLLIGELLVTCLTTRCRLTSLLLKVEVIGSSSMHIVPRWVALWESDEKAASHRRLIIMLLIIYSYARTEYWLSIMTLNYTRLQTLQVSDYCSPILSWCTIIRCIFRCWCIFCLACRLGVGSTFAYSHKGCSDGRRTIHSYWLDDKRFYTRSNQTSESKNERW